MRPVILCFMVKQKLSIADSLCLKASFEVIYRSQKGVPTAQNVIILVILSLFKVIVVDFIFYMVYYFPVIGDAIFNGK